MDEPPRTAAVSGIRTAPIWGASGWKFLAGDLSVIGLFLAAAAGLIQWSGAGGGEPQTVTVEVAGKQALFLDLGRDRVEQVPGPLGPTWFEIRGRRVRILDSPCPLKLGIRAGWIDKAGDMLVCLPNQVVVTISGNLENGLDAVAR